MRKSDEHGGLLELCQDLLLLRDSFAQNRIHKFSRRAGNVHRFIDGRMIGDAHLVKLVNPQSQHLTGGQIESGGAKPLNDKVKKRTITDHAIERLGNKRAVDVVQSGVLQHFVQYFICKLPARLPVLQRFQTT
jgi:hypothetical protein